MPSPLPLTEGCVVEFANKGKFCLGVVLHTDAKTGKIKVFQSTGRELTLTSKQVLHLLPMHLSTGMLVSNMIDALNALAIRAENIRKHCDVEDLWMLVSEEGAEISLEMLVTLLFSNPEPEHWLAVIYALRTDRIYFKEGADALYTPRPASVVEDLRRQAAQAAAREQYRNQFVEEVTQLLALPTDAREEACENSRRSHPEFHGAWTTLSAYAIYGQEASDKAEAEAILVRLQDHLNRGFSGTAHLRARAFLREVGYWQEDTNIALLKYDIATDFDDAIEDDALAVYRMPHASQGRADLTHLDVFSIDSAETLDIDDALSIEMMPGGAVRLGIHIAAPAAAIPFDSSIEHAARLRATSLYLPEQRIPMMPAILGENALSLIPNQTRAAVSFFLIFDQKLSPISSQILPSYIISKHKLSYEGVENLLEFGDDTLSESLRLIYDIVENSQNHRRTLGAIDVDLPESKLTYDTSQKCYVLHRLDLTMMSRLIVSECMILANTCAADFCHERNIPALYRIQSPPTGLPSQEEFDAMPNDLMRAVVKRRCMQSAVSSLTPGKHAGLGLERYTQVTSPLRRYIDLLAHYQLEHYFVHQKPRFSTNEFSGILAECDLGLDHARSASQEAYFAASLAYLQQLGDENLTAIILQYVADRGDNAQVMLVDLQMRTTIATKKRWPPGTMCFVKVDHANPDDGTFALQFVDVVQA
ncbi:MAG: ribonuclease catalytic domain-containing protein [Proteobacteria bacterium]|nr:ribonuclease catalytic domain-containing protein [Pseudomonadota bacterium]